VNDDAYYRRAVELYPQNFVAWELWGRFNLSHKKPKEGLEQVTRAYELAPENPNVDFYSSTLHGDCSKTGDMSKPNLYSNSCQKAPSKSAAIDQSSRALGFCRMQMGPNGMLLVATRLMRVSSYGPLARRGFGLLL
jgi:hypothetical protein